FIGLLIGTCCGRQQLESNTAVQLCVLCEVNFAHPARAELPENTVMRDRLFDNQSLLQEDAQCPASPCRAVCGYGACGELGAKSTRANRRGTLHHQSADAGATAIFR